MCKAHSGCPVANLPASACPARRDTSPSPVLDRQAQGGLAVALRSGSGPARSVRSRVGQDGSGVPFRVVLPSSFGATGAATKSFRTSLRQFEDEPDGFNQSLPARGFRFELRPPFARQAIELCLTPALRFLPIRCKKATVFEPVQRRIKRSLQDLDHTAR